MDRLEKLYSWLASGDTWVGVFENHDLGHADRGRRVAMPFSMADYQRADIGSTHAPDMPGIGLGWRYILIAKCRSADDALHVLDHGVTVH